MKKNGQFRKQKFLVLDSETGTLPIFKEKEQSINHPIVYNIAWKIVDRKGVIYKEKNYVVTEVFFNERIFNTAYYKNKRPLYMQKLNEKAIEVLQWKLIIEQLKNDCKEADFICCYNALFDLKKAIPFTNRYINALYSENYDTWENSFSTDVVRSVRKRSIDFMSTVFALDNVEIPIIDIWCMACERIMNNKRFREWANDNKRYTESGKFYSTNVETCMQYLTGNLDFTECHTAMEDVNDECQILLRCLHKRKAEELLTAFPFQKVGKVLDKIEKV